VVEVSFELAGHEDVVEEDEDDVRVVSESQGVQERANISPAELREAK
jgi:hypothetical protein